MDDNSGFRDVPSREVFNQSVEKRGEILCFRGSEVPVGSMFQAFIRGVTIHAFVESHPPVSLAQAQQVLLFGSQRMTTDFMVARDEGA